MALASTVLFTPRCIGSGQLFGANALDLATGSTISGGSNPHILASVTRGAYDSLSEALYVAEDYRTRQIAIRQSSMAENGCPHNQASPGRHAEARQLLHVRSIVDTEHPRLPAPAGGYDRRTDTLFHAFQWSLGFRDYRGIRREWCACAGDRERRLVSRSHQRGEGVGPAQRDLSGIDYRLTSNDALDVRSMREPIPPAAIRGSVFAYLSCASPTRAIDDARCSSAKAANCLRTAIWILHSASVPNSAWPRSCRRYDYASPGWGEKNRC